MPTNTTYLIRVWIPDRPGALGAIASRLGALRGDVIGFEIVERDGGQVIDEIAVSLPPNVDLDLVSRELSADDEVRIEEITPLVDAEYDPHADALETAELMLSTTRFDELSHRLCERLTASVRATWACVIGADGVVVASVGDIPPPAWLSAFVLGSAPLDGAPPARGIDTISIEMADTSCALVVAREHPFGARERRRLSAMVKIADHWGRITT